MRRFLPRQTADQKIGDPRTYRLMGVLWELLSTIVEDLERWQRSAVWVPPGL
jgi:hypothetical protein